MRYSDFLCFLMYAFIYILCSAGESCDDQVDDSSDTSSLVVDLPSSVSEQSIDHSAIASTSDEHVLFTSVRPKRRESIDIQMSSMLYECHAPYLSKSANIMFNVLLIPFHHINRRIDLIAQRAAYEADIDRLHSLFIYRPQGFNSFSISGPKWTPLEAAVMGCIAHMATERDERSREIRQRIIERYANIVHEVLSHGQDPDGALSIYNPDDFKPVESVDFQLMRSTPLHTAASAGLLLIVKKLCEFGANYNRYDMPCKCHFPVVDGSGRAEQDPYLCRNFIEKRKYDDMEDDAGKVIEIQRCTPLMCAVRSGHHDVVEYLQSFS